jgi:hypothetical protein
MTGAIIAAGALIGLGLAAVGLGVRYQAYPYHDASGNPQWVLFRHLDTGLMVAITALIITLLIGLGIAFVGLAYHHRRRHHEIFGHEAAHPPEHRVPA